MTYISDIPLLMKYWDFDKNEVNPYETSIHVESQAFWKCPDCGYEWTGGIRNTYRTFKECKGCKKRAKLLEKNIDKLYQFYDFDCYDNKKLEEITPSFNDDIQWKCSFCDYIWKYSVWNMLKTDNAGRTIIKHCPNCNACANKKTYADRYPKLAKIYSPNNAIPFAKLDNTEANRGNSVLWICEKCGLEFERSFRYMKKHMDNLNEACTNCNVNISRISEGESFAEVHPELLKEYNENNIINPYSVMPFSKKEVIWNCPEGHSWKGTFAQRHRGQNCPECNKKSSLQNLFLDIYKQFSPNNVSKAENVKSNSTAKYLWTCENCGKEYMAKTVDMTTGKVKCPYCSEDAMFAYVYPDYLKYWNYEKNESAPEKSKISSIASCHWTCENNHQYMIPIAKFVEYINNNDEPCPYCSGRKTAPENSIAEIYPEIIEYWAEDYYPDSISPNSGRDYKWICDKGHEFKLSPFEYIDYLNKDRNPCPYCDDRMLSSEDSFASKHPELVYLWDAEKNKSIGNASSPDLVAEKSLRIYWWKCKEGHSFGKTPNKLLEDYENNIELCPYCRGWRTIQGFNSLRDTNPELEEFWADERDFGTFNATNVEYVKWKCKECGGIISAPISDYVSGNYNCKYCNNNRTLKGFNSLLDTHPEFEKYWRKDNKNEFSDYRANNTSVVKWICPDCGETVYAPVNEFINGNYYCYVCQGERALEGFNSLQETHSELYKYWRDTSRKFTDFTEKSKYIARWACPECGGEYNEIVNDFINGDRNCPYCNDRQVLDGFNSLRDTHPELEPYWSENNGIEYNQIRATLSYSASWICPDCGGEYNESINKFVNGERDCPYCNDRRTLKGVNSLEDTHPELKKYWSDKNEMDYSQARASIALEVRWICPDCGGEYNESINDFVSGNRDCPYCNDRRVLPGYNSFKVKRPDLMKEWNELANCILVNADEVSEHSNEIAWWKCNDGHNYKMSIARRVMFDYRGITACPYCKGLNRKKCHKYKYGGKTK